jgi:hypothetical protein
MDQKISIGIATPRQPAPSPAGETAARSGPSARARWARAACYRNFSKPYARRDFTVPAGISSTAATSSRLIAARHAGTTLRDPIEQSPTAVGRPSPTRQGPCTPRRASARRADDRSIPGLQCGTPAGAAVPGRAASRCHGRRATLTPSGLASATMPPSFQEVRRREPVRGSVTINSIWPRK